MPINHNEAELFATGEAQKEFKKAWGGILTAGSLLNDNTSLDWPEKLAIVLEAARVALPILRRSGETATTGESSVFAPLVRVASRLHNMALATAVNVAATLLGGLDNAADEHDAQRRVNYSNKVMNGTEELDEATGEPKVIAALQAQVTELQPIIAALRQRHLDGTQRGRVINECAARIRADGGMGAGAGSNASDDMLDDVADKLDIVTMNVQTGGDRRRAELEERTYYVLDFGQLKQATKDALVRLNRDLRRRNRP